MSITLMSAIFKTEFRDLQDAKGNTTKASTAKFICIALADHANDEGEGAYPAIDTIAHKTNLSRTTVINGLDALKYNGILTANGASKRRTIDYTINKKCFSNNSQPALLVSPLDPESQPGIPSTVNPVDPNHPLTVPEPFAEEIQRTDVPKRGDLVDGYLAMINAPGIKSAARQDNILSYLAVSFQINTETKRWREFAKFADSYKQKHGGGIEQFVSWVKQQKGFDITFWTPQRMQEMYPQAFVKQTDEQRPQYGRTIPTLERDL